MLMCKDCDRTFDLEETIIRCECGGLLENELQSGEVKPGGSIWKRYRDFFDLDIDFDLSIGEGTTPLVESNKISKNHDIELYFKNETVNPTWSFKDRGTFTGVNRAMDLGFKSIGTVSTGNMGVSVAAYGSRSGLDTTVLVSSKISDEKVKQISAYDPRIIKVTGDYGELYFKSLELGLDKDIYFLNSDDPFRVEGYKTISYELFEESVPDHILIPTSSGGLFRGVVKGFLELRKSGLISDLPNFISIQSKGCSPIYDAFKDGKEQIEHWDSPRTVAHSIANPYPPSGDEILRLLKKYDGDIISVGNGEILSAQKDLAGEGISAQPASCVGIAALDKLKGDVIKEGEKVVSIVTGSGLKDISAVEEPKILTCDMDDLIKNL